MQYYADGSRGGDPRVAPPAQDVEAGSTPDVVDVCIVGSGPAGLLLAAQLSEFGDITTRVLERRDGPLVMGQADGVACRTVETFEAFGLADRLVREAYWVNEATFWEQDPDEPGRIVRTERVWDVEDGLSEFPHVIVNQARLQALLLEKMERSPRRLVPDYGVEVAGVDTSGDGPVTVQVTHADGTDETIRAKYVVGCDGARSAVRTAIGRELRGDRQNKAWGVLDVLSVTDFPDIRRKVVIGSQAGAMLIIPREGGHLVRLYVDLGDVEAGDRGVRERTTSDDVIARARAILAPHTLDVKELVWWSVYEVGQRLTDKFDEVDLPGPVADDALPTEPAPRVFIAGDACHTHSAKAGQGMNVSMQDTYNLGWKFAAVLRGQAPEALLHTYSAERQRIAQELIDFDKDFSRTIGGNHETKLGPGEVAQQFTQAGRFTAGVATHYPPGVLVGDDAHQDLAEGFTVGMRLHSAPVMRVADAKPVHLGHVHVADGRWRVYVFAGSDGLGAGSRAAGFVDEFTSVVRRFTPAGADLDAVFDVRAITPEPAEDVDLGELPELLRPTVGRLGLTDYEKVFTSVTRDGEHVYAWRGVSEQGAVVVVRPDQYVAQVLPLEAAAGRLGDFFGRFLVEQGSPRR